MPVSWKMVTQIKQGVREAALPAAGSLKRVQRTTVTGRRVKNLP